MQAPMNKDLFEIIHSIGAGATAEVFKARNTETDNFVALKSFSSFVSQDEESLTRLRDEIQILKSFDHPNVVKMLGEHTIDNQLCLELELVEGQHLRDWMKNSRNPLVEVDLWILVQVARGLGAVHEKGFIHRDLKPENILISEGADVKLSDFGLAKELNRLTMTRLGLLVGSLGYMAPEVTEGEKTDMKSDIFSFGAVAYELISGKPPIKGETPQAVIKNAMEPVEPLSQVCPHVSPRVAQVIDQCLAMKKEDRPESIWAVESEFMGYLNNTGLLPLCRELVKFKPDQVVFKKALTEKKSSLLKKVDDISNQSKPDKKELLSLANELTRLYPEEPKGMELLSLLRKKKIENPKKVSAIGACLLGAVGAASAFFLMSQPVSDKKVIPQTEVAKQAEQVAKPLVKVEKPKPRPQLVATNQKPVTPTKAKPKIKKKSRPKNAVTPVRPRAQMGSIKFLVDDDVSVYVDGVKVSENKLHKFKVKAGDRKVKMVKEGFMPIENTVKVRANKTTTINARGGQ